jgi:hypothetical protein
MPDYARLFPTGDFRWHMSLRQGSTRDFFAPTENHAFVLEERAHWLREMPADCAFISEMGVPLLEETCSLATEWGASLDRAQGPLLALASAWEPDFVLLLQQENGFIVEGGAVCFPSHWTLRQKLGSPLEFTHSVVPGLNEQLGSRITAVLTKLAPGAAWLRENWGLARDGERNHHPLRSLPRLDETITPDEIHLRIEHQCLAKLPRTGGILFGIRLEIIPWNTLIADPVGREGIRAGLTTISDEAARYKGIASVRSTLLRWLSS